MKNASGISCATNEETGAVTISWNGATAPDLVCRFVLALVAREQKGAEPHDVVLEAILLGETGDLQLGLTAAAVCGLDEGKGRLADWMTWPFALRSGTFTIGDVTLFSSFTDRFEDAAASISAPSASLLGVLEVPEIVTWIVGDDPRALAHVCSLLSRGATDPHSAEQWRLKASSIGSRSAQPGSSPDSFDHLLDRFAERPGRAPPVQRPVGKILGNRTDEYAHNSGPNLGEHSQRRVAMSSNSEVVTDRSRDQLREYDEAIARLDKRTELESLQRLAGALLGKAYTLGTLGLFGEERAVYDEVVARFVNRGELTQHVSKALFNKVAPWPLRRGYNGL